MGVKLEVVEKNIMLSVLVNKQRIWFLAVVQVKVSTFLQKE